MRSRSGLIIILIAGLLLGFSVFGKPTPVPPQAPPKKNLTSKAIQERAKDEDEGNPEEDDSDGDEEDSDVAQKDPSEASAGAKPETQPEAQPEGQPEAQIETQEESPNEAASEPEKDESSGDTLEHGDAEVINPEEDRQEPTPEVAEEPYQTPNTAEDLVVPSETGKDAEQDAIDLENKKKIKEQEDDYNARKSDDLNKPRDKNDFMRLEVNQGHMETPHLKRILRNGTYVYKTTSSPQREAAGFRIGPFDPVNLASDVTGATYAEMYGKSPTVLVTLDYELQLFKRAGKLAMKGSLGFLSAHTNGRFVSEINANLIPDETITLFLLPLGASAIYRAQFWEKQIFVPFGEVGADYFTMLETRNDKKNLSDSIKYGGAPAWHWAAGLQIQLDFLDREGLWQIDEEYGINHVYLTANIRQISGLSKRFDFTSTIYEGGILFEF